MKMDVSKFGYEQVSGFLLGFDVPMGFKRIGDTVLLEPEHSRAQDDDVVDLTGLAAESFTLASVTF